jgi:hypothetical protein
LPAIPGLLHFANPARASREIKQIIPVPALCYNPYDNQYQSKRAEKFEKKIQH